MGPTGNSKVERHCLKKLTEDRKSIKAKGSGVKENKDDIKYRI